MDAQTINQSYDLLALAMGDTKLKRSGAFYIGACPFCGGTDRFNLKQTPEGWRWFCRKCGEDKYHGSIDYIMRRDHLNFKQALESLGGSVQIRPREMTTPQSPALTLPDPAWQSQRWQEIEKASNDLLESLQAQSGRDYLLNRSLDRATWKINLLGFGYPFDPLTKKKRPAILIPWWDVDTFETITAIKYRFIDDLARQGSKYRFGMAKGSKPILFGLHAAAGHKVLIFTEGEINAMSITRTSDYYGLRIDSLSFGSETGSRESILHRVAQDYRRVIVWADKAERSQAIRSSLACPADTLCSPVIDGVKYDANALLQKGLLSEFLRETIKDSRTP